IVSVVNRELETNTVLNIGNMFAWRDRDGNSLKKYSFFDTGVLADGGFVSVNGIRQNNREWFTVNARDIERGLVKYHAAQVPDNERLRVKVSDGKYFSKVKTFRVDTVQTPEIDTPDHVQVFNDSTHLDLSDWLNQTDNGMRVTKWQFFDATTEKGAFGNELTGSLAFRGNALEPQRVRTFNSDQLADITFKSGVIDRGIEHDEFYVRGNNGSSWSDWQRINTTTVFNLLPAMEKPPAKWGPAAFGTGTTLTYSFMEALPAYYFELDEDNGSFIPFSAKMRQTTREIFKTVISEVFDINLVEVSHTVGGTIQLGLIDNTDAAAYAYYPPGFGGNP
ncbi:MAG: hypothetical protein VX438_14675, partial [Planctomycetota bacterium]|nr:hypothetical protein [Planctomycetota bacterium]